METSTPAADEEDRCDDARELSSMPLIASRRQLLLLAVLLPAAVAITNQLLFSAISNRVWPQSLLYPWMAFSTAVLSWCVGRYLNPPWFRWLVFGWCLALLDILTIAACLSGPIPGHVGYVLVSAQITLVAAWTILGPWAWQWRLPVVLVAMSAIVVQSSSFMNRWNARSWNLLMILTTVVVVLLCIAFRVCRFRLQKERYASGHVLSTSTLHASQFGVKHMLIWATALVPILLVVRGLDTFVLNTIVQGGAFSIILLAVCLAAVNLVAIWAVLGGGFWLVRLSILLLVPLPIALGLSSHSAHLHTRFGRWNGPPIIDTYVEMRDHWLSWLWLDAALLAALLLFLRANGYRLQRKLH
jgi:hypothetical protein